MKRLITWLCKPPILALLGVLLLSLVIWFEAPLLAFDGKEPFASAAARGTLILLLLLAWAGWFGWRWYVAWRASRKLMEGVAGDGQPAARGARETAAELEALTARMQEAMAVLRQSRPGMRTGSRYMYQLPWYMFIGAPGSGKTTALTQSGLQFPVGAGAIGGVGGTRNCDWWFTDEAVLLDTAGRYTTQDSYTEVDKAAWGGFLDLLKKHRGRQPINGVIVALSVSDLLQLGESGRKSQALAIRERLRELHARLGVSFPVYVMVTKCDLLAGFSEFHDLLGRDERAQVWGMSFPLAESARPEQALALFPAEFAALERQLQVRLIERMEQERDLKRRGLLYSFPQQFAGVGDALGAMLGEIFQSSVYGESALLRGVYFTSGTQDGRPIDRVMGALAGAFGLDRNVLAPNAASGRSYFLTRLLREVIFREAELGGLDWRAERRRQWLNWAGTAAIALALLGIGAALIVSRARNAEMVALADERAAQLEKLARAASAEGAQGGVLSVLPLLDAARALPAGHAERNDSVPLLNRVGLYQGDKLGAGAQTVYRRLLRETLLPRIVLRMEAVLRRGDANSQDLLYETLRVYLMLGERKYFEPESVQAWLDIDWRRNLEGASTVQRRQLSAHVGALLADAETSGQQLDPALIAQVRLTLARMPLPQRVYNSLKRQVGAARLPEFSINAAAGRDVSPLLARRSGEPLTRGLSGLYSVAGYRKLLELSGQAAGEVARDSWVLDRQESAAAVADKERIQAAVLELYYADYIEQWDGLLADIRLAPFSSLDQAARITTALAAADTPLRPLLQAAARETELDAALDRAAAGGPASVTDLVRGKLDQARKKLESALDSTADAAAGATPEAGNPVTAHFAGLHKLAGAAAGGAAPLDGVLAQLKDAALFFDAADGARRSGAAAPAADALVRLRRAAEGTPAPLGALLQNVDSAGSGLTLGNERARLNALWAGAGAQFCREAIGGRYPLARGASREITAEDFGRFFGPGGSMDDFFTRNLAQYVDMGAEQWRWRSNGAALGFSQDVLDQFQRGARLRDMMFAAGGRQPSLRFEVKPLAADAAIAKALLEVDGQPVAYTQGVAARATAVALPSGKDGGRVRLETTPALRAELSTEGPWAWFRMLDKASLTPVQGEKFTVGFDLEGRKISYELTASSVVNPFRRGALEQFRCPAAL